VQQDGTARLADFGLAAVRHNGATLTSLLEGGTLRWMAVELFQLNDGSRKEGSQKSSSGLKVTRESDIWSFGMLALELLTGSDPFPNIFLDPVVIMALVKGERPPPPGPEAVEQGLDNRLWRYLKQCWDSRPDKRPSLNILISVLNELAGKWSPSSPIPHESHHTVSMLSFQLTLLHYSRHPRPFATYLGAE
jgi:serine/threonine protein kinase